MTTRELSGLTIVTRICHDSPTRDSCPALYRTDQGDFYVQGGTETDHEILAQMDIPDGEAVVKVTPRLLGMIAEWLAAPAGPGPLGASLA